MSVRFIDLFAGIGGIRMAFEQAAHALPVPVATECVFASELDRFARRTYARNHGREVPADHPRAIKLGDGTTWRVDEPFNENIRDATLGDLPRSWFELWRGRVEKCIPDHDVLLGGFPCQPFSLAGKSKRRHMGRAHGLDDHIKGTLFDDIARILEVKQPKAFLLENVKHLARMRNSDGSQTYDTIVGTLGRAGYRVSSVVLDAAWVLPQHRERIFLVGIRDDLSIEPSLPTREDFIGPPRPVGTILHSVDRSTDIQDAHWTSRQFRGQRRTLRRYDVTPLVWATLVRHRAKHADRVPTEDEPATGFGYGLIHPGEDHRTRTISARYHKDGAEILIAPVGERGQPFDESDEQAWAPATTDHAAVAQADRGRGPRRLTPRECARLQGFPDDFVITESDTQAYRQFGNSVPVPVVRMVAELLLRQLHGLPLLEAPAADVELTAVNGEQPIAVQPYITEAREPAFAGR